MSQERRIIRPYLGVDAVQAAIADVVLRFGQDRIEAQSTLTVPVTLFMADRTELVLVEPDEAPDERLTAIQNAVKECDLDPGDTELVLVLSASGIKSKDIAWRFRLDGQQSLPREVRLDGPPRPRALQAPVSGCDFELFVALSESQEPQPLRPSLRGAWLARNRYRVSTDLGTIGWRPVPLTDDLRKALGLHPETIRFIEVNSVTNPDAAPEDAVVVYVDESVLAELTAHVNSPGARHLQLEIFLDAMRAVIHAGGREVARGDATSLAEAEGSVVERLLAQVCDERVPAGISPAALWNKLENEPEQVVAYVEGWIPRLRDRLTKSIGKDI